MSVIALNPSNSLRSSGNLHPKKLIQNSDPADTNWHSHKSRSRASIKVNKNDLTLNNWSIQLTDTMNTTPQFILKIRQGYPELTGKLKTIADYILSRPEVIITHKVKEIASACQCDDALVIRFCKKVGYSGLAEMRASFSDELLPVQQADNPSEEEPFDVLKNRMLEINTTALRDTMSLLRQDDVQSAAKIISNASRVFITGIGASGFVAMDLQLKLMRIGLTTVHHSDNTLSKMIFNLIEPSDAVIAISFSGETDEVCQSAKLAADRGAEVVAITNFPNCPLADYSNVMLLTACQEKSLRIGAMASRLAQLAVVDLLMVNIAINHIDRVQENVLKTLPIKDLLN